MEKMDKELDKKLNEIARVLDETSGGSFRQLWWKIPRSDLETHLKILDTLEKLGKSQPGSVRTDKRSILYAFACACLAEQYWKEIRANTGSARYHEYLHNFDKYFRKAIELLENMEYSCERNYRLADVYVMFASCLQDAVYLSDMNRKSDVYTRRERLEQIEVLYEKGIEVYEDVKKYKDYEIRDKLFEVLWHMAYFQREVIESIDGYQEWLDKAYKLAKELDDEGFPCLLGRENKYTWWLQEESHFS